MAHYVSGQLPFRPSRFRGLGQMDYYEAEASSWLPVAPPQPYVPPIPSDGRRELPSPSSPRPVTRAKKKRRTHQHGDTVHCVFIGRGKRKKKIACYRTKTDAQKRAKRERLKRVGKAGVYVVKSKFELKCKKGQKRVCKARKKGSRACAKWGCSTTKSKARR